MHNRKAVTKVLYHAFVILFGFMMVYVCDPVPVPDGTLDFKLTTTPDGGMAQFYYRQPQGEWQSIGPACPTDILTDEHCRGFTGAHVGVYAHDMAGLHNHADFDYLNVHFER